MKTLNRGRRFREHNSGFTLLEVLIALVVLSIGMLGIAALQGVGLRSSQGAYLASQASLLAYDMADRIRANPTGYPNNIDFTSNCPPLPLPTTPLEVADRAEWSCAVEALLPSGIGRIVGEPVQDFGPIIGTITRYTITLTWEDLQSDGTPWNYVLAIEI